MQRFGNEVITFISRWLHILWNFSIHEIARLFSHSSDSVTFGKLAIIIVVMALIGGLFWFVARQVVAAMNYVISVVVYVVLVFFLFGACAWGINWLWVAVPNVVALR